MDEEKVDAIVVGGGLAGCTAAYCLAKAGLEVVVIERGSYCGSKNMTGGRLYGHSLEKVIPHFVETAPVERLITKERLSFLTETSGTTIDFTSPSLGDESCASYSVLRAPFDQWLAEQAEAEGALFVNEIRVDNVIVEDGRVCGVRAGDDDMYANVVILADGALSLLGQKLGMVKPLDTMATAVSAKEIIQLDEKTVSDRFGVSAGEGCAWLFDGYATDSHIGGGFLYTNRDSISLGVVTTIGDIDYSDISVPQMLTRLEQHPVVAPLIAGGTVREYGGRMILEGGLAGVPELTRDGVLLVGDAAGFGLNLGYCVRGMDLAIESGRLAAEAVIAAKERDDFSKAGLAAYETSLKDSFIMKDLQFYQNFPHFMESTRKLYKDYPEMIEAIMNGMFRVDGREPEKLTKQVKRAVKATGTRQLIKDAKKGLKAL